MIQWCFKGAIADILAWRRTKVCWTHSSTVFSKVCFSTTSACFFSWNHTYPWQKNKDQYSHTCLTWAPWRPGSEGFLRTLSKHLSLSLPLWGFLFPFLDPQPDKARWFSMPSHWGQSQPQSSKGKVPFPFFNPPEPAFLLWWLAFSQGDSSAQSLAWCWPLTSSWDRVRASGREGNHYIIPATRLHKHFPSLMNGLQRAGLTSLGVAHLSQGCGWELKLMSVLGTFRYQFPNFFSLPQNVNTGVEGPSPFLFLLLKDFMEAQ